MTRTWTALLTLALLCAPAAAQERSTDEPTPAEGGGSANLEWTFKVGTCDAYEQTATIKLEQTTPMGANTTDMTVASRWTQTVTAVDAKGTATITLRYDTMSMKVTNAMGTVVDFDSTRPEDMARAQNNPQLQPLADMIGKSQELKVSKTGKVLSASGGPGGNVMSTVGDWQMMFVQVAGKPIGVGKTWKSTRVTDKQAMKMSFDNTHTLKQLKGGKTTIVTASTAKADFSRNPGLAGAQVTVSKSKGKQTTVVDFAHARLESLKATFELDMEIGQSVRGQTMTITQNMSTVTAVKWLGAGKAKTPKPPTPPKTGGSDF